MWVSFCARGKPDVILPSDKGLGNNRRQPWLKTQQQLLGGAPALKMNENSFLTGDSGGHSPLCPHGAVTAAQASPRRVTPQTTGRSPVPGLHSCGGGWAVDVDRFRGHGHSERDQSRQQNQQMAHELIKC